MFGLHEKLETDPEFQEKIIPENYPQKTIDLDMEKIGCQKKSGFVLFYYVSLLDVNDECCCMTHYPLPKLLFYFSFELICISYHGNETFVSTVVTL